jgi:hypothetical protein
MPDLAPFASERRPGHYPARSKMLDMYTVDISRMLTEGRHDDAQQAALAIPHIAVALADAALQSSCTMYQDWCGHWVQPDFGAPVYSEWCGRSKECREGSDVPFAALRALRLQRRAREVSIPLVRAEMPVEARAPQAVALALLGAVCRWYEQEGRYDSLVQTNLARLGVLR